MDSGTGDRVLTPHVGVAPIVSRRHVGPRPDSRFGAGPVESSATGLEGLP